MTIDVRPEVIGLMAWLALAASMLARHRLGWARAAKLASLWLMIILLTWAVADHMPTLLANLHNDDYRGDM